ncbi:hypothetical protein U1Q18_049116, partial [Sarracenia purpurea var. burkii]
MCNANRSTIQCGYECVLINKSIRKGYSTVAWTRVPMCTGCARVLQYHLRYHRLQSSWMPLLSLIKQCRPRLDHTYRLDSIFRSNKSDNLIISKISNIDACAVAAANPMVINLNNEESDKPYSETLLVFRDDEVKIPSLTKTFLQNRTTIDKERTNYAGSVIKINVAPQQQPSPAAENRTIVTITPEEEHRRGISDDVILSDTNQLSKLKNSSKTSITINFDDRSPSVVAKPSQRNNTVTINVGYKDCQTSNVLENYRSNIEVTPEHNEIYIKSNESSNEISTQTETIEEEFTSSHICDCSSKQSTKSTESIMSGDSFEDAADHLEHDFSLHYMSCKINEKLTEDEVGLNVQKENEYDSTEPIYEEISETPPPLPLEPPPAKVDDVGIVIPPRSIFEGASKYDILRYLAGAKERCKIPEEPEFVVEEAAELEPSDSGNHSRIGSIDLSCRISHLSNVSDSSDELLSFLNASVEK